MIDTSAQFAREILAQVFSLDPNELPLPQPLSLGMTNRSYLAHTLEKDWIVRLPGEGANELVSRRQEYEAYQAVLRYDLCDHVVYLDPVDGIKITGYIPEARVCDPTNQDDLRLCMHWLRRLHDLDLQVPHAFNPFDKLQEYENLRFGKSSVYADYAQTKQDILSLRPWLDDPSVHRRLCHVDANPDNFLLYGNGQIRLIDWEYAALGDPLMDLSMFAIYTDFDKAALDHLTDLYFQGQPVSAEQRHRIYGWAAVSALTWSNWCEFKALLGVDFGSYALQQYRLAKYYLNLLKGEQSHA